jgi:hypothetical protein
MTGLCNPRIEMNLVKFLTELNVTGNVYFTLKYTDFTNTSVTTIKIL